MLENSEGLATARLKLFAVRCETVSTKIDYKLETVEMTFKHLGIVFLQGDSAREYLAEEAKYEANYPWLPNWAIERLAAHDYAGLAEW